jgi:hypothetical protein
MDQTEKQQLINLIKGQLIKGFKKFEILVPGKREGLEIVKEANRGLNKPVRCKFKPGNKLLTIYFLDFETLSQ